MNNNEKGYALLIVFVSIIFISIVGIGLLTASSQSLSTSTNEKVDQSLYFAAEAGLNYSTTKIKEEIQANYLSLQDSPPNNFDVSFRNDILSILSKYSEVTKDSTVPPTLLSTTNDKKVTAWVDDINISDPTNLITFKIYSEGKFLDSNLSRKVERKISIPKNLHKVVGYQVTENDYKDADATNKDTAEFLKDLDDQFINDQKKYSDDDEKNNKLPAQTIEIPANGTLGNIYVSENTDIFATRHQHLNAKINYYTLPLISPKDQKVNAFHIKSDIWRTNNSKELINKFNKVSFNKDLNSGKGHKDFNYINTSRNSSVETFTFQKNNKDNIANINIASDKIYKVPALQNQNNYTININLSNNAKPTFVFSELVTDYDLSNIIINVSGSGEVNFNFNNNFIINSNKKLIIKKINNSTAKINANFNKNLGVVGTLEIDGDVSVYRKAKFYYKESIITGDLYVYKSIVGLTSDLIVFTLATLNVNNVYIIDKPSISILDPFNILNNNVKILGSINFSKIYTEDFTSFYFAKLNTKPRKTTLTPGNGSNLNGSDEFLAVERLIEQSPILEVK